MVDDCASSPKMCTVSVRIEDDLIRSFEVVSNLLNISKSDFLRACIEKLSFDNNALIDHYPKMSEYVQYIKNELAKLPSDMIEVINGTWADVNDKIIVIFCDEFWKTF